MKIIFLGIKKAYRKEILTAINCFAKEFPIVKQTVRFIYTGKIPKEYKNSFGITKRIKYKDLIYDIKLNRIAFSCSNIETKLEYVCESNYESITDIIIHELTHSLTHLIICKYFNIDIKDYLKSFERIHLTNFVDKILNENHLTRKQLGKYIGNNAVYDDNEFIAEIFNNYFRLRTKESLSEKDKFLFCFVEKVFKECSFLLNLY